MFRLLIALSLLLFIACRKDKDAKGLIGKWRSIASWNGDSTWGGCFCWENTNTLAQHTLEFKWDGTFVYKPPGISSFSGCSGEYQRPGSNTITWKFCGPDYRTDSIVWENEFLIIVQQLAGGFHKFKYQRK